MSLFGNPKVSGICGNCHAPFETRDWRVAERGEIAVFCGYCGYWNLTGLALA